MKLTKIFLVGLIAILQTACAYMGIGSQSVDKLTAEYTDSSSKFVNIDGLVMHYQDSGTGPVVLMLHGETNSLHIWDDWVSLLDKDFRVIRLDLPGHGLTGPDSATSTYDLEYMMTRVNQFIDRLGLGRVQMVGHSVGGFITWNYAMRYPERVERMVLVSSLGYVQDVPPVIGANSLPVIAQLNALTLPRYQVEGRVEEAFSVDERIDKEDVVTQQMMTLRKGNRGALIDLANSIREQVKDDKLSKRIKYIQTPTLLMWGEDDQWADVRTFRQMKVDFPNVSSISYEEVGHLPMLELPYQSARDIRHYLKYGEASTLPDNQVQGL